MHYRKRELDILPYKKWEPPW